MSVATKKEWLASLREPQAKKQRMTIVPMFVWAILFCFVLAAVISKAHAEDVIVGRIVDPGGSQIVLLDAPCGGKTDEIIKASVQAEYQQGWKSVEAVFRMGDGSLKRFSGCWMEPPVDMTGGKRAVLVLFEDGDNYVFPRSEFDKTKGTEI